MLDIYLLRLAYLTRNTHDVQHRIVLRRDPRSQWLFFGLQE